MNPAPATSTLSSFSSTFTPQAISYGGEGGSGYTQFPLLVPKVEPKTEPFDETSIAAEPAITPQQKQSHESTQLDSSGFPNSNSASQSKDNVLSESQRASDLCRAAFSKRLEQRYGGDMSLLPQPPDESQVNESLSIVRADDPTTTTPSTRISEHLTGDARPHRRHFPRSGELVRVGHLGIEDERAFRDMVRRTRMVYDALRIVSTTVEEARLSGERLGRRARGDLRASVAMRERGLWLNRDKRIVGSIPGVQIGDVFVFRMELCVVGLHGQPQAGIDYLSASQSSNGEPIATSIIVSGGYEDDEDSGDVIIYTGQGGQDKYNRQCEHQRLEGGNLALERSMYYGIEVRVIRGIKYEGTLSSKVYVYDGLYKIHDCWFDVGKSGFGVFKYKVVRLDGQREMGSSMLKLAESLRTKPLPTGYISLDVSNGIENVPILLFNNIDKEQDPLCYQYLKSSVFPAFVINQGRTGTGCDCVGGCIDGCLCAMKNGGLFAYDQNGFLLRGKPVVFECGQFCRCPPSCRNRVSQMGLRKRLEVFRSRETAWGVRSLDLILAGAFICEYAGVILTREQAQILAMNGDSLIYPDRFAPRWAEWGDLSQIHPDYVQPSHPSLPPLDFAMDVSKMRNVACYMSHSSIPNVMVQFVLYDHNNLMFPHLMLFAMENIPPLTELSLDYGVADEWSGKLSICS